MTDQIIKLLGVDRKALGKIRALQMYSTHINEKGMSQSPLHIDFQPLVCLELLHNFYRQIIISQLGYS